MPQSIPKRGAQFVYQHIENSGISAENPVKDQDMKWEENGVLKKFDQREFVKPEEWKQSGLGDFGYLYYPNSCITQKCALQFVFSGVKNEPLRLSKNLIPIASSNNMALIFPSVAGDTWRVASKSISDSDPEMGNDEYLTKNGLQIKFVKALYDKLVQKKDPKYDYKKQDAELMKEVVNGPAPWDGGRPSNKEENLVSQIKVDKDDVKKPSDKKDSEKKEADKKAEEEKKKEADKAKTEKKTVDEKAEKDQKDMDKTLCKVIGDSKACARLSKEEKDEPAKEKINKEKNDGEKGKEKIIPTEAEDALKEKAKEPKEKSSPEEAKKINEPKKVDKVDKVSDLNKVKDETEKKLKELENKISDEKVKVKKDIEKKQAESKAAEEDQIQKEADGKAREVKKNKDEAEKKEKEAKEQKDKI